MYTYISFLRAVNMAGHNSIRMADLSALYRNLGFIRPETYIQSGNVIFGAEKEMPPDQISSLVEEGIFREFGYDVPVIVKTIKDIRKILSSNPFLTEKNFDPAKMAVIFIRENLDSSHIRKVADVDYPPDKFKIIGNEIFTFCPNGFGRTKIYTGFFEKKMKVKGTARNWNTIMTILDLAEKRNQLKAGD